MLEKHVRESEVEIIIVPEYRSALCDVIFTKKKIREIRYSQTSSCSNISNAHVYHDSCANTCIFNFAHIRAMIYEALAQSAISVKLVIRVSKHFWYCYCSFHRQSLKSKNDKEEENCWLRSIVFGE